MNLVLNLLKPKLRNTRNNTNFAKTPPWSVLFFGTDDFSIYSLKAVYCEYKKGSLLNNLEVVTTTKGKWNPVRKYAKEHQLCIHSWPEQIPNDGFDIGLVVSFGHLIPESVIKRFNFGMLNVHASLLPRWRGAAPMIYALANGDKETGVTIMKIKPKYFDIGEILLQKKMPISDDMRLPELHKNLGNLGANCLIETLHNLPESLRNAKSQPNSEATFAPKVTSDFAVVRWDQMSSVQLYNLDRALTGLFHITSSWNGIPVKLLDIRICAFSESGFSDSDREKILSKPGFVSYDKKSKLLKVVCAMRTCVSVERIGVFGKKIMSATDFYNGYLTKDHIDRRFFV